MCPDVAKSLPCWLSQFSWLGNVRTQQKKLIGQSYFYTMRKVWYHQIWIPNYHGFIVLILNVHTYFLNCHFGQKTQLVPGNWKNVHFILFYNFHNATKLRHLFMGTAFGRVFEPDVIFTTNLPKYLFEFKDHFIFKLYWF